MSFSFLITNQVQSVVLIHSCEVVRQSVVELLHPKRKSTLSPPQSGGSWSPCLSLLECWLVLSCAGLVQTATAFESLREQQALSCPEDTILRSSFSHWLLKMIPAAFQFWETVQLIFALSSLFCDFSFSLASCNPVAPTACSFLLLQLEISPLTCWQRWRGRGLLNYAAVTTLSSTEVKFLVSLPQFLEGWTSSPCWMLGKPEDADDAVWLW